MGPLLILLGILVIVGIGVAVVNGIVATFRWLSGAYSIRSTPAAACPLCGEILTQARRECRSCGWPKRYSFERRTRAGLASLARRITFMRDSGLLDADTATRLLQVVHAEARLGEQGEAAGLVEVDLVPDAPSLPTPGESLTG